MTSEIFLETTKITAKKRRSNVQFDKLPRDKNNPYTMISNSKSSFLRDSKLSSSGKGILSSVISFNLDQWKLSINGLSQLMADGKDKISSTLNELERKNYLIKKRVRDELGRYEDYVYHFFETSEKCLAYKKEHKEELAETEKKSARKKSVKTKSKKTAKTTETVPEVVTPMEQTRQVQPPDETPDKIITAILEQNISTVTQEFAKNTASYLISAVNKGIIALDIVKDKLNAIIDSNILLMLSCISWKKNAPML